MTTLWSYLALLPACGDPAERCAGNIEVCCDADGCTCASGEYEGEAPNQCGRDR